MVGDFRQILDHNATRKAPATFNYGIQGVFNILRGTKTVANSAKSYGYRIFPNQMLGFLGVYAGIKVALVYACTFTAIGGLHLLSARRHKYVKDF
jgi:hypothetical protein